MKNKYQEALDTINEIAFKQYEDVCYSTTSKAKAMVYERRLGDSTKLLKELVDKETSMKLLKSQFDGYRECGNCKSIVVSTNHVLPKYCSECGQRIDWSDEE